MLAVKMASLADTALNQFTNSLTHYIQCRTHYPYPLCLVTTIMYNSEWVKPADSPTIYCLYDMLVKSIQWEDLNYLAHL